MDRVCIFIDGSNFYHALAENNKPISSDADYKSAIEALKFDFGKTVELHQVAGSKAYDLITVCSSYHPITDSILKSCVRVQNSKQP